ncbi:MAG: cryptochrome/photolyase family protein [Akkermansiaceae bacterium]
MEVALIYPHQLFQEHPALKKGRTVFLIEDPLFFGTDSEQPFRFHAKKLMLHRASMKSFAKGKKLNYVELPEGESRSDWLLDQTLPRETTKVICVDPVDYLLERRIKRVADARGIEVEFLTSPMFLTPDDWMAETMDGMKKPFMKTFYEAQRKRMGILVEPDGKPVGGKWSFDADNRKKLPKKVQVPEAYSPPLQEEVKKAATWVKERFPTALGVTSRFQYGTTREEALEALELFLKERFELFGDYEDAISVNHRVAFHSVLTPYLNIGLLTPQEMTDRVLDYGIENKISLNCIEGFIRQVVGWREFMRIIYLRHGVFERKENFWGFTRKIPSSFYDGTTGIEPIDHVIQALLEDGYCHHIERLMVLGNFMMLCRFDPDEVYRWFMEFFIDAYDWVMVPNVYGMSQFADGGIFATKPYLSGSNYIRKMSDFKKGDWCDVWDGLFWSFVGDHGDFFRKNYRLAQMARLYERMDGEKKALHYAHYQGFIENI